MRTILEGCPLFYALCAMFLSYNKNNIDRFVFSLPSQRLNHRELISNTYRSCLFYNEKPGNINCRACKYL